MKNKEMRRVNPVSHVAGFAVLLVLLFEAVFLTGVLELKAETVRQHAPWAYEYFLKLAGEHPSGTPKAAVVEVAKPQKETRIESTMAQVAGILMDDKPEPSKPAEPALTEETKAVAELVKKVTETEPEVPAVPVVMKEPAVSVEPKAVPEAPKKPVDEKTVEEMVEEQMKHLPEIPPEPEKPAVQTNDAPPRVEEELPVG